MNIELLDVSGFEQAKLILAHLNKFYIDGEGDYCLRVDERLALRLEKNIRRNKNQGIHFRVRINGVETLEQVTLVKYIWSHKGLCVKFKKTELPRRRQPWWARLLQFQPNY